MNCRIGRFSSAGHLLIACRAGRTPRGERLDYRIEQIGEIEFLAQRDGDYRLGIPQQYAPHLAGKGDAVFFFVEPELDQVKRIPATGRLLVARALTHIADRSRDPVGMRRRPGRVGNECKPLACPAYNRVDLHRKDLCLYKDGKPQTHIVRPKVGACGTLLIGSRIQRAQIRGIHGVCAACARIIKGIGHFLPDHFGIKGNKAMEAITVGRTCGPAEFRFKKDADAGDRERIFHGTGIPIIGIPGGGGAAAVDTRIGGAIPVDNAAVRRRAYADGPGFVDSAYDAHVL